eukprot:2756443-Rhodomonas_salina.4
MWYWISNTETGYAAFICCAMSGCSATRGAGSGRALERSHLPYPPMRGLPGTDLLHLTCGEHLPIIPYAIPLFIILRPSYAVSGTDTRYAATRANPRRDPYTRRRTDVSRSACCTPKSNTTTRIPGPNCTQRLCFRSFHLALYEPWVTG